MLSNDLTVKIRASILSNNKSVADGVILSEGLKKSKFSCQMYLGGRW